MIELGVNIDHVATLRQARRTWEPDPVWAAVEAHLGGADGITVHLREDRRHIQDADVRKLRDLTQIKLNLEMAATVEMVGIACDLKPQMAMFVPEGRHEVTTEGGLDIVSQEAHLKDAVARLAEQCIIVSVFIEVTGKQLIEWLEKELNNVFASDASKRFGGWVVKFQGMEVSFNAFGEIGKRIQNITIKGQEVSLDKMYSILACERDGDPEDMLCRIKDVKEAKNTDKTLHKVMLAYLSKNSPVTPTPAQNAKILDAPTTLLTQVSGVDYEFR